MKYMILIILFIVDLMANSCSTKLFTLQSRPGLQIQEVINTISQECGFSVIVKDKFAQKKLSTKLGPLYLKQVPITTLLQIILKEHNLDYTLQNNILIIRYLITKTFHLDYVNTYRKSRAVTDASVDIGSFHTTNIQSNTSSQVTQTSGDINSITAEDKFDFWNNIQNELYHIVNRPGDEYQAPQPVIDPQAGLVTITGTPTQIQRVTNYIKKIEERLHKEVFIDVSILAVLLNKNTATGIDWSKFGASIQGDAHLQSKGIGTPLHLHTFNSVNTLIDTTLSMRGIINFLQQEGKVITLSNPKILTLNNQPAIISIGDTINFNVPTSITIGAQGELGEKSYTPSSIFVGILLNITPEITANDNVILRINPSISELRNPDTLTSQKTSFREIAPDTREKKISTVVRVKNGSTLILGGLISRTKNFTINGVPIMQNIPVLGKLFTNTQKDSGRFELVFVLKTKIITPNAMIGLDELNYHNIETNTTKQP